MLDTLSGGTTGADWVGDNAGNLKKQTLQSNNASGGGAVQTTTFDYDSMNRRVDTKQYDFGKRGGG